VYICGCGLVSLFCVMIFLGSLCCVIVGELCVESVCTCVRVCGSSLSRLVAVFCFVIFAGTVCWCARGWVYWWSRRRKTFEFKCMYTNMHVRVCEWEYACDHSTWTKIRPHTHKHAHTHTQTYTHSQTHTHKITRAHTHVHTHTHKHKHIHTHTHTHIHTHTNTHARTLMRRILVNCASRM